MSELLAFARGPLFLATFAFMVLGLLRHIGLRSYRLYQVLHRTPKRDVPWGKIVRNTAGWLLPVKHIFTSAPTMKIASIAFHIGIVIVPVFLADHVLLWSRGVGIGLPGLSARAADILTLVAIGTGFYLFGFRILNRTARNLSGRIDYFVTAVVLVPLVSGYLASHPESAPLTYEAMMLIHVLSAELLFVLMPTTKLAHVVLFPFDRLSPEIFWRLVPGAGDRVAEALRGNRQGVEA
jgi:nitrate reductase gamma subunit